eukprot:CAMPEP_0198682722 /NCGR_PEP_ID=MMETSP1468-20131203/9310_1 /TAXON_ID=1461545 /ORGANISM="Mantoniella sp, Strain CCMP1436" /LENGTH=73 /DNA_ID=CAMNT_0044426029 /DNA_START=113 /DNA_END=331 /DNA_ORIENTATION=-
MFCHVDPVAYPVCTPTFPPPPAATAGIPIFAADVLRLKTADPEPCSRCAPPLPANSDVTPPPPLPPMPGGGAD